MNYAQASQAWRAERDYWANEKGVVLLPEVQTYLPDEWKRDYTLALDAQPQLMTEPSAAIPLMLTSSIDPDVFRILFTPLKAVEVLGEEKRGDWTQDVIFFPVVEPTGEVSSYGDFNNNGRAGVNAAWPQRQQYLFQVIKEYGERELDRAALGKINLAAEIDRAAATVMNRFLNHTYLFGVLGLQNYGLLNDPALSAAMTPKTKAAGGTAWLVNNQPNATANEAYDDVVKLFSKLVEQTAGLIQQDSRMLLVLGSSAGVGLTATNSFNVNVNDLLKKNFPNLEIVTVPQYDARSATRPDGVAAGGFAQLWALEVDGQNTGFAAYSEKYRDHPLIRHMSSFRQKASGGSWGSVIRFPGGVASLVGI